MELTTWDSGNIAEFPEPSEFYAQWIELDELQYKKEKRGREWLHERRKRKGTEIDRELSESETSDQEETPFQAECREQAAELAKQRAEIKILQNERVLDYRQQVEQKEASKKVILFIIYFYLLFFLDN